MNTNTTKPAQCRFDELADGEVFHLAMHSMTNVLMQRVNESDDYNSVLVNSPRYGQTIPDDAQVVRVRDEIGTVKPVAAPVPKPEPEVHPSDAFTLVMLKSSMYMFKDIELDGGEWAELQLDDSIYTVPLPNDRLAMLVNQRGEYCFIFWDEADQCSQPYPTVAAAKAASAQYAQNIISEACALADEMNDNMRKYGTIDKPAQL